MNSASGSGGGRGRAINYLIKNFSFLLSKSPIRFCPENPIQISRRAGRGGFLWLAISLMVRERGLEPPRLTAYAPQAYVFTNYTTRALPNHFRTSSTFILLRDKLTLALKYKLCNNLSDSAFAYLN